LDKPVILAQAEDDGYMKLAYFKNPDSNELFLTQSKH